MPQQKLPYFTKLAPDVRAALRRYKDVVGVPEAVQIDKALREWLEQRPEAWPQKADRRRAGTRKRP
jgi:hypothetical protein